MFRSSFAALAASLLLLGSNSLPAQEDQSRTFQGTIEVREIGVVVEPAEGKPLDRLRPEEILVFEEGTPRQVTKAEPLRPGQGASPWTVVLYFDRTLAGPETVRGAALVLARQARRLAELGPVEIVVANPEPRVELTATRDARGLSTLLGEISGQARREVDRPRNAAPPAAPDPATLRRQLDRLTAFLGSRPGGGAQALFLIADGFVPPPGEAELLANPDATGPVPPETVAAVLRESSRVLAGYGWVTFAGPLRESTPERERRQMADLERIRIQGGGGSKHGSGVPPVIPMPPPDAGPRGDARVADTFSRQDSAPLMALAQPTAGTVLGVEEQLAPAIEGLTRRWRVWYRAPETLDGRLRRVEVRLPDSGELRSPRWVRSATPEGLAAARARLLAGGAPVPGGNGDLRLDATAGGGTLKLRVPPFPAPVAGPVRITLAFDNTPEIRHLMVSEESLEQAWEEALDLQPPAGARRVAVLVEDLVHGRWGGTAVSLP